MSALAARRAAQAAQASAVSSRPIAQSSAPTASAPATKTPSMTSSDEESNSEAGPSKRRKTTKKAKPARYFAPVEVEEEDVPRSTSVKKSRTGRDRTRRFSPSAPASDAEVDSSDEEGEEADSTAEQEVDEGRAAWTAPTTPLTRPGTPAALLANTTSSKFKAVSGTNFCLLSEGALKAAGLAGEGAGVVISLGKQDVSPFCAQGRISELI
jgi:hypothetical protein